LKQGLKTERTSALESHAALSETDPDSQPTSLATSDTRLRMIPNSAFASFPPRQPLEPARRMQSHFPVRIGKQPNQICDSLCRGHVRHDPRRRHPLHRCRRVACRLQVRQQRRHTIVAELAQLILIH
jgi:hypothetical protein